MHSMTRIKHMVNQLYLEITEKVITVAPQRKRISHGKY